MHRNILLLSLLVSILFFALMISVVPAQAQVTIPPEFTAITLATDFEADGLALSSDGGFGNDLFVAVNTFPGEVRKVNPTTGVVTPFATGLTTGIDRPSGLAFGSGGGFGNDLFVTQNTDQACTQTPKGGTVVSVSPAATVSTFSSSGTLCSSNDLAFPPPGSPFGDKLFVTNGPFSFGNISEVDSNGVNSVFVPKTSFPSAVPVGLAFPPPGSMFGSNMFVSVIASGLNGTIREVTPAGGVLVFATGLGLAIDLAFSSGGAFGDNIYVSDPSTQSILKVAPNGDVTTFATGFSFTQSGFDADLVFSFDGNTLFVANGTNGIIAITPTVLIVDIDIKPGSDPNCFNLNGNGVIPVAILGNTDLDVSTIKTDDTLVFAGLQVRVKGNAGPQCSIEYSNSDEFLDLICHFEDDPIHWITGTDDYATLNGELLDGTPIEGIGSICIVP